MVACVASAGDTRGALVALDARTGMREWPVTGWVATSTTLRDVTLYALGGD